MSDWLPKREADLINWAAGFDALVSADAVVYGLTIAQATEFNLRFTTARDAYNLTLHNNTRTPSAIQAKDDAMAAMTSYARELAAIVQANPDVTNQQRRDLGLPVHDREPTPAPRPVRPPVISLETTEGRNLKLRLRDIDNPDRRGKPDHVAGASVLFAVGDQAPVETTEWSFLANATRTLMWVAIPGHIAAGSKVWLTASWYNTRGEAGPAAQPLSLLVNEGLSSAA